MAIAKNDGPVEIPVANIVQVSIPIIGIAPLVQCKFSQKAREQMMLTMSTPKAAKKSKDARPPRNYDADFAGAQHLMGAGDWGIPCIALKAAMVRACTTGNINIPMTRAKLALWVLPDGLDMDDGTPLTRLLVEPPERLESLVRNDNGSADIRIRPMWRKWRALVTIEFDRDMITDASVVNLLDRAGRQVGIGEGRQFSTKSVGQNWGSFTVPATQEQAA